MKKDKTTNTKWKCYQCGRCGKSHSGYTGKLDKNGVEYVVCEQTNKRMNVSGKGPEENSWAYPTFWLAMTGNELKQIN